jgi:hypothetical protein
MTLLPWPEKAAYTFQPMVHQCGSDVMHPCGEPYFDAGLYNAAVAEAALQRLRVAVEALEYCRMNMSKVLRGDLTDSAKEAAGIIHARAFNALHEVGEVPGA